MRKGFTFVLIIAALLIVRPAAAKDIGFMPSTDVGMTWFFLYDDNSRRIQVDPALSYGVTFTQQFDFTWARNVSFDLSYFHAEARGLWDREGDTDDFQFDMVSDYTAGNIGYFFSGRRIHPYIAAGLGAMYTKFQTLGNEKVWETDPLINFLGGLDYTVWEVGSGLQALNLGARLRYAYLFPREFVHAGFNAINVMFRLQLRF